MKTQLKTLISKNKQSLFDSDQYPLLNNNYLNGLDVPDIQNLENISTESILNELGEYPKFKNIKPSDITNLRLLLHLKSSDKIIEDWCIKILRHIEICRSKLKHNEKTYGRSKEERIQVFNQVIALFVEYYLNKNDLIFFNTALKILDLKWIEPMSHTPIPISVLRDVKLAQIDSILKKLENE